MEHVILVIHLILTLALIGLILIQRSEGGGLGLGTGGGMGSFASASSTKNAITKTTTIIAICFFTTSLILAIMASRTDRNQSILDAAAAVPTTSTEVPATPVAPVPAVGGGAAANTNNAPIITQTPKTAEPSVPAPTSTNNSPKVPLGQ